MEKEASVAPKPSWHRERTFLPAVTRLHMPKFQPFRVLWAHVHTPVRAPRCGCWHTCPNLARTLVQMCAHPHMCTHMLPSTHAAPHRQGGGLTWSQEAPRDPRFPAEQGWNEGSREGCQQKETPRGARPCDRLVAVRSSPVPHVTGAPGTRDPRRAAVRRSQRSDTYQQPKAPGKAPATLASVSMSVK